MQMKILWLDINSSYSHSSVALPAIHSQVSDVQEWEWCVIRATINDNPGSVAAEVAAHKPDVIAALSGCLLTGCRWKCCHV